MNLLERIGRNWSDEELEVPLGPKVVWLRHVILNLCPPTHRYLTYTEETGLFDFIAAFSRDISSCAAALHEINSAIKARG
jgi:hypothetical protein